MTTYIKLKPNDIIVSRYKTHPSYSFQVNGSSGLFKGDAIFLETEEFSSYGSQRNYFDIRGEPVTGSWNISGSVEIIGNSALSNSEKRSINRLRNIYASGSFIREHNFTSSSVFSASTPEAQYMTVVNIPSVLYGSEIKPGSFRLSANGGPDLSDDGYGGILSNSVLIGSVFYQHGVAMLGHHSQDFENRINKSRLYFSGTNEIPCTMYICTAPRGLCNFSNNSSFYVENTGSHKNEITTVEPETFVTTVGLYDEDYNLIGVAKTSKPIMNKEETSISFKLKLNY